VIASGTGSYLVIAFFETRAEARDALLAASIEASTESRNGWIGMLALGDRGGPEVVFSGEHTGARSTFGAVLGVIASALLGGVMPPRSHFFDSSSDLTTDDVVRFGAELEAGHPAVAVLARRARADRILVLLAGLGGKTEIHRLTDRALREAASASVCPPAAS
jgi:hypothetical protein